MKAKQKKWILGGALTVAVLVAAFAGTTAYFDVAAERSPEASEQEKTVGVPRVELANSPAETEKERVESTLSGEEKPESAVERLAESLAPLQRERLLELINEGTVRELLAIHGVGKNRAEAIQKARPFESIPQLVRVPGVGAATYASVIEFGKQMGEREAVVAVLAPSVR